MAPRDESDTVNPLSLHSHRTDKEPSPMAQNSWQRKKQTGIIQTAQGIYAEMIESMRQEVITHKDNVINAFVTEQTGATIVDVTEIAKRGYLAQAEDTSEVFNWDGYPRIYFAPVDMQKVNGTLRPVLKYQHIPLLAEPEAAGEPDFSGASDEFKMYLELARENNWHIPVSDLYVESTWLKCWKEAEANLQPIEDHH